LDEPYHSIQRRSYEPVTRRIDCEFFKAAEHLAFFEKEAGRGRQEINVPTDPGNGALAMTVATSKVSTESQIDGIGEKARD
jgi:hypothetical protein